MGARPLGIVHAILQPRTLAALRLSFTAALAAAVVNVGIGLLTAWVLGRYGSPAGGWWTPWSTCPSPCRPQWPASPWPRSMGRTAGSAALLEPLGVKVAYTPIGVFVALLAVGLPFVVRAVQPVLEDLDASLEEAAETLGAGPIRTFARVIVPALAPALLTGFAMAFARGAGEYGSVIFIAGNMPGVSEIAPLVIVTRLEQYDYAGAAAVGLAMLAVSLLALIGVNALQVSLSRRGAR